MQTSNQVVKIGKKFKQDLHHQETPVLGKGKKFNKPQRGKGTYKSEFLKGKEVQFKRDSSEGY